MLTIAVLLVPACAADEPCQDPQPLDDWPHCRWLTYDPTTDPPTYTLDPDCFFPLPPVP